MGGFLSSRVTRSTLHFFDRTTREHIAHVQRGKRREEMAWASVAATGMATAVGFWYIFEGTASRIGQRIGMWDARERGELWVVLHVWPE